MYDPYIKDDITANQYHDLDEFLKETKLVVIMVGHDEIKENQHKLSDKVVLDTRKVCTLENVYTL